MKFTILEDPSLVIITIYLVCLINALESREKELLKSNAYAFSLNDLYGHILAEEPLPHGS